MDTKLFTRSTRFAQLIALEIRGAITARDLTIKDVAESIGVERATLSRYFTGKREIPISTAEAICIDIEISLGDVIDRAYDRLTSEMGDIPARDRDTAVASPALMSAPDVIGIVSDDELEEALQLPYAARRHVPGPESQDV